MDQISIQNIFEIIQDQKHYHIRVISTENDNPYLKNGDYACIMEFKTYQNIDKSKYIHDGSIVKYEINIGDRPELSLLRAKEFKTETILYPLSRHIQIDPIIIKNDAINASNITGVLMFSIHDFANLLSIK